MRAQTSLGLTEGTQGNRDFIRGTLAQVITDEIVPRSNRDAISIFNPLGLGVLDLSIGAYTYDLAQKQGLGTRSRRFSTDRERT